MIVIYKITKYNQKNFNEIKECILNVFNNKF